MRILLTLRSLKDCVYDKSYYHKLQGFIYGILKESAYAKLHNKEGYKFFCFSNIFPPEDMKEKDSRNLMISSPDKPFIKILESILKEIKEGNKPVNIGEMSFRIEDITILDPKLQNNTNLITGTPIIIRIPKENYEKYGITPRKRYDYVYWKQEYSFPAFLKQLEDNLFKKYNEFHKTETENFPLFQQFFYRKPVCNHIIIGGREVKVIGSLWEFIFSHIDRKQEKILKFGLDTGFGELNSMGFGFMNIKLPEGAV